MAVIRLLLELQQLEQTGSDTGHQSAMRRAAHRGKAATAMRHRLITASVRTNQRSQMIDVTDVVQQAVTDAGVEEGMAIVYVPHTTAACTINENADPDVQHDMLKKLSELIPQRESYYRHGEGNSDSHVKTSLVGNSATVLIEHGQLVLGRWQGVYFCEFDGPRNREMLVKVVAF
jgi:secondary thiamine-phosphate synthase enzyme